jgi:alpha-tubulin suppressor-like RCC1 family protein
MRSRFAFSHPCCLLCVRRAGGFFFLTLRLRVRTQVISDRDLYSWGSNRYGQLGRSIDCQFQGTPRWVQIHRGACMMTQISVLPTLSRTHTCAPRVRTIASTHQHTHATSTSSPHEFCQANLSPRLSSMNRSSTKNTTARRLSTKSCQSKPWRPCYNVVV